MNIAVYLTVLFCLLQTGQALIPACPQVKCSTICKEYLYDENGCQTCKCKACEPVLCEMYCKYGWAVDEHGCEICKCRTCEPVRCRMYCKYGWDVDEHGCEICKCRLPCDGAKPLENKAGEIIHCGRGGVRCPENSHCDIHPTDRYAVCCSNCSPVMCKMYCKYGFQVDKNGCEICSCRPCPKGVLLVSCLKDPCEDATCSNPSAETCRANYCGGCNAVWYDSNNQVVSCNTKDCSPVMCDLYCEHGFQVDEHGCEICSCRPCPKGVPLVSCLKDPCEDATCSNPSAKTCKANYCGGCNAVWYDSNNQVVSCNTKG